MLLQKFITKKREGFTLIELMIVVVIIGILAMVAVPAFIRFVRRSKTSEATSMLGGMYDGAQTYYQTEQWTRGVNTGGTASAASVHCVVPDANSGNSITSSAGEDKDDISATLASNASFGAINFSSSAPVYYQYDLNATASGCGIGTNALVYTFSAFGNLDGDATTSTFELQVGTNTENTLYHSPGIYRIDELE